MTVDGLDASVQWHAPLAIIQLRGELRRSADQVLQETYRAAVDLKPSAIALDFGAVGYINSAGIALIVSILDHARHDDVALLAWGLSEHYREIFEITRLDDYITIVDDESTALRTLTD